MKKLDEISRKAPFRIPDNYFDEVNLKIISATSEIVPVRRKSGIIVRLRPVLRLAAFITGFIIASYFILKTILPADDQMPDQGISMQELSGSFLNDIELAVTEEEGAGMMPEEVPDVSDSDLIEYLITENVNTEEIYEHF